MSQKLFIWCKKGYLFTGFNTQIDPANTTFFKIHKKQVVLFHSHQISANSEPDNFDIDPLVSSEPFKNTTSEARTHRRSADQSSSPAAHREELQEEGGTSHIDSIHS